MKLLRNLALVFIDAFGITHPSVEARDRAAKYIAFLMIGLLLTLCSMFFLALKVCVREARRRPVGFWRFTISFLRCVHATQTPGNFGLLPKAELHLFDAGHFAFETHGSEIVSQIQKFFLHNNESAGSVINPPVREVWDRSCQAFAGLNGPA
jgi:hypothetical protein